MKGMAAATVPAASAVPLAAASGCPSRRISSFCARPGSGALPAGVAVCIRSTARGSSAAVATGTATVHLSKLGLILDDAKGRTHCLPEAAKSTTPTGGEAYAFAWPPLTSGTPQAAPFARSEAIGTSKRSNGTTQVTFTGHRLHRFAGDTPANDANGEKTRTPGATVARRRRIGQQGRTGSIGD
ncbi:hypothetical protein AB0E10_39315 [Streptomyces sp. NPDC048045]|uniref:hypothetical protein n=1 Tax=Streptomyces sp. NPDC048045 TaxID=3154710 RepID=UPI00342538AB